MHIFNITISIEYIAVLPLSVKAGINAIINARVSILAAANPAYGKYNNKRSIEQNISLPAALFSRFDLVWLIPDKANREMDLHLAKNIIYVHNHLKQVPTPSKLLDIDLLRRYIKLCKRVNPSIPEGVNRIIVEAYVQMRSNARAGNDSTFTSPRNLMTICRLSIACARLRLSNVVEAEDVSEVIRLLDMSMNTTIQFNQETDTRIEYVLNFSILFV